MPSQPPDWKAYLVPVAMFATGTAMAGLPGGATASAIAGTAAAIGAFLANLGPNLVSNLFAKSGDARDAARDFALNDTLSRAFGRAAGALMFPRSHSPRGDRRRHFHGTIRSGGIGAMGSIGAMPRGGIDAGVSMERFPVSRLEPWDPSEPSSAAGTTPVVPWSNSPHRDWLHRFHRSHLPHGDRRRGFFPA